ncbi:vesicle-associated membrane protein-associated protein C16G5.05c [Drosophila subpulchrella]|uniref:vesicle-associated membrane protein-associated protein C16G5.05c n=1 Tax=Drosophila subpulchrella TaxID=1486046 RepID=UPI0018A1446F|nr:vesicle-associated membrane protein-associated protein C16G5.05c [Drosophila subpulchrella]
MLCVSPQVLTFYAPYDRSQRRIVTLLNPTNRQVLFKIKSKVWRHYIVIPSSGGIEPYTFIEVSISLKDLNFHEDLDYNHQFSIQYMNAPRHYFNGQTILPIFGEASRRNIFTKSLFVHLEVKPISLANSSLDSLSRKVKINMEEGLQLRALCPNCPKVLAASQEQKKTKRNGLISKLVIIGSLVAVVFIAYMQRVQMYDVLIDNFYSEKELP